MTLPRILFFGLFLLLPLSLQGATADANRQFLERHWQRPIAPQGEAPASFSALEAALDPDACGTCHIAQLADWKDSRHAHAMDPGVLGQLLDMEAEDRASHQECLRCHAPLAEQAEGLAVQMTEQDASGLHRHGMMCAACHVRGHRRYGPPRRDVSTPQAGEALPHGGFRTSPAFEDARFCASCHQFPPDGYALNGKLLENTLEEWQASRHAREGRTCQSCHMPDRRHLWRGIHDPEMVRQGVTITSSAATAKGRARASLTLRNSATGHYFPTYVTPKIYLEILQEDAAGKTLAGTLKQEIIGREVTLDITRELSDTRLAPDAQRSLLYDRPLSPSAVALVARVRVEPDYFYVRVYRSLLTHGLPDKGMAHIRRALHEARRSGFELYRQRTPVTP